ncbi:Multidrug resistance-associated protein 1 [Mortierella sp. AD011]|nr:Multidrug resistance-associated protein 1 [Mortierella sp. AD010]KAF9393903.1 Multidrug resistance-associated protein 1 [Mortierella sp. AD011]
MSLAAIVILVQALVLYRNNSSPVATLGCLVMGFTWITAVQLNHDEHIYEIRSSTSIFAFYVASIGSTVIILHTHFDLPPSDKVIPIELNVLFSSILFLGLIFEAWPRGSTRVQQSSDAPEYDKANIFSRLVFYHYQNIISIGLRRTLTPQDTANILPRELRTDCGYKEFSTQWNQRLARQKHHKIGTHSLFWTIIRTQFLDLVPIVICRIAIIALSYLLPLLLSQMLSYLQDYEDKPLSYGFTLACGMFLISLCVALLYTYNRYQMFLLSVSTKAALIAMIYRKALKLSPGSRMKSTTGEITNHMAVDAEQWGDAMLYLSLWVSIPIEIGVALYLLYKFLGWSMIAGFLGLLAFLPVQTWQAKLFEGSQGDKLNAMDQRIRLTTEVLAGMRVVRLYGWSAAFLKRILSIRRTELNALRRIGIVQTFMSVSFISSSLIISLITFGVYSLWGGPHFTPGKLTPQTVFVSMTLFSMLKGPVTSLSEATTSTIGVLVGTKRIQEFLLREEVSEDGVVRFKKTPQDPNDSVIFIKDATFSWTSSSEDILGDHSGEQDRLLAEHDNSYNDVSSATLQSINLSILSGKLTAVVGRVGQGKSSLLSAIIGEMYKIQGKVQISGKVAYVPQQAWIVNATLRDNVLFGNDYDEERYRYTLYACGLEPDIAMLPAGDMTEIGERGINLSGGQKQRVSLARAAYDNADIYLLDDPLSAVDAHVDRHLWDNLIGPSGLLHDKARVLVTHGIHHLKDVDQIIVLKEGSIVEQGHYGELMKNKQTFYQLIKEYSVSHANERKKRKNSTGPLLEIRDEGIETNHSSASTLQALETNNQDVLSFEEMTTSEDGTENEETSGDSGDNQVDHKNEKKDNKAELIAVEYMKIGNVDLKTSHIYFRAMSYKNVFLILALFIATQACLVGSSLWLKYWIKRSEEADKDPENPAPSVKAFLGVYALLTLIYVVLYLVIPWLVFAVARIRASEILFRDLITKILHLPMSFFDTTPLGRILNRFSSDFSAVDERIPNKFFDMIYFGVSVVSTFMLVTYTTPKFIYVMPFLIAGYWVIQNAILRISTPLVRIYSVSKSPLYQHFSESLNGVSTIRAMAVQERFIEENTVRMDYLANNFLASMSCKRWVEVQLRLLSTFVLLFASLFAVLGRSRLDPSLVGLTLSFAMSITEEITSLVRIYCDFQTQLVAVERVVEYTDMKTEAPDHTDVCLPPRWPAQGRIQFKNYSTRYREGLDLVLKNISIEILPGESVGIVGRTGAGKSSLTLALFRVVEAANSYWAKATDNTGRTLFESTVTSIDDEESPFGQEESGGSIEIDGVDISTIGLEDLRKSLAIIPQDPTLFAGSIRDNLDPFSELEDIDLWEALERSHLKTYIQSLPGGLLYEVSQNGENFSVGQRSLICLARALLRKTKILIMDEATAAVDVETDELIQRTIRQEFKDRTVLTIAHRIKTVMDSDKILVLEKGRVSEFDSPGRLLKNKDSLFYKLAEQAGEI